MRIIHRLAHFFGVYHGKCFSFWDGDKLMMSFKCTTCGDMSGVHDTGVRSQSNPDSTVAKVNLLTAAEE